MTLKRDVPSQIKLSLQTSYTYHKKVKTCSKKAYSLIIYIAPLKLIFNHRIVVKIKFKTLNLLH
jgi:hypothetical protein